MAPDDFLRRRAYPDRQGDDAAHDARCGRCRRAAHSSGVQLLPQDDPIAREFKMHRAVQGLKMILLARDKDHGKTKEETAGAGTATGDREAGRAEASWQCDDRWQIQQSERELLINAAGGGATWPNGRLDEPIGHSRSRPAAARAIQRCQVQYAAGQPFRGAAGQSRP